MRGQMRFVVIVGVAVVLVLISSGARADGRSAFTAADLMRLQRVSDLRVSPDGHYAVFALTQPDVGHEPEPHPPVAAGSDAERRSHAARG